MYRDKTIGVVVPAYNEEQLVGQVIDTMPDYVDRVYVVDDCSKDNTLKVIRKHSKIQNARDYGDVRPFKKRIVPIHHAKNKGVGGAIKTGYLRAIDDEIDVTAVMGGDAQMKPEHLYKLLDPIIDGEADYTKGNRLLFWQFRKEMTRWRFFGNALLTFLTKISSGYWKTMDPQNGYTAISKFALKNINIKDMYEFYGYCNDILVKLNVEDMTVADVAIPAVYGEESSGIRYRSYIIKVSRLLTRNFFWRMKTKYLLLDFHPLALFYLFGSILSGFGAGLACWSLYRRFFFDEPMFMRGTLSLLVFIMGSMFIMFAMLFDMQVNQHKEKQIH